VVGFVAAKIQIMSELTNLFGINNRKMAVISRIRNGQLLYFSNVKK
jgi:hypothetical protein